MSETKITIAITIAYIIFAFQHAFYTFKVENSLAFLESPQVACILVINIVFQALPQFKTSSFGELKEKPCTKHI